MNKLPPFLILKENTQTILPSALKYCYSHRICEPKPSVNKHFMNDCYVVSDVTVDNCRFLLAISTYKCHWKFKMASLMNLTGEHRHWLSVSFSSWLVYLFLCPLLRRGRSYQTLVFQVQHQILLKENIWLFLIRRLHSPDSLF